MAFEMYTANRSEWIDHHEEYIFSLVEREPKRYPQLNRIWREFYNDPPITPEQSEQLVQELMDLLDKHKQDQATIRVLVRLLPFFYFSGKEILDIHSRSD